MSEEAEKKFQSFDFSSDVSWQEHYKNLFPTPTMDKLAKIKRKWFKKNIDSSLEVETNITQEEPSTTNDTSSSEPQRASSSQNESTGRQNAQNSSSSTASSASTSSSSSSEAPAVPAWLAKIGNIIGTPFGKIINAVYSIALPMKDKFYFLEGILKFVFIICALLFPQIANMLAFNACLLGFFRQTGKPVWDMGYGKKALENEFLQNILYMIPFAFFPNQKTLVYFLPLGIHFWIGLCEFVNLRLPSLYPKIAKFADFTRQNRGLLMLQKAKLEIMLFVFIIVMIFFGGSNLVLVLFYGNFLKSKYLLSPMTKRAFQEVNYWVETKMNSPYCPGIVKFIVNKVRSFCEYLVRV